MLCIKLVYSEQIDCSWETRPKTAFERCARHELAG